MARANFNVVYSYLGTGRSPSVDENDFSNKTKEYLCLTLPTGYGVASPISKVIVTTISSGKVNLDSSKFVGKFQTIFNNLLATYGL